MNIEEFRSSPAALRAAAQVLLDLANTLESSPEVEPARPMDVPSTRSEGGLSRTSRSPDRQFPISALAEVARNIYTQRRGRDREFGLAISNEPLWDMMLDLFIQRVKGKRISVSSMCIASSGPATTALRYIDLMESHGLIEKSPDPIDKRRTNVEISPSAFISMARHLNAVLD